MSPVEAKRGGRLTDKRTRPSPLLERKRAVPGVDATDFAIAKANFPSMGTYLFGFPGRSWPCWIFGEAPLIMIGSPQPSL